jgi:nitrogen fixation NifU-like protein
MTELRELYQEVILDHSKRPRNFGELAGANRTAEGFNPLCGDHYHIHATVEADGTVTAVGFEGSGCAISKASASMLTQAAKGKSTDEVLALFTVFHAMVTGTSAPDADALGKLAVFAGVCEFPVRVKCASLAWHTLKALLTGDHASVTTE